MAEQAIRVGFQGERGAYSEEAAVAFFKSVRIEPVPHAAFDDVFAEVESGKAAYGIVPIENSLGGSIHRNYDLLLRHNLYVIGEVAIRVAHCLIAHRGVTVDRLRQVYSHPQALAQCERSLGRWPHVERVSAYDTAGSVKLIKESGQMDAAAIASRRAAEIYDMEILAENIEDDPENYTRFLMLNREPVSTDGPSKTSIVFSMRNQPGALFRTLAVFALRDIDLMKIESRPLQGKAWDYFFYVDFAGGLHEEHCRNALSNLKEFTEFLRVLGSYPRSV
jgi:prephenate dehydratase